MLHRRQSQRLSREAPRIRQTVQDDKVAVTRTTPRLAPLAGSDSLDWKDLSAGEITSRVLERVKPGSIVLFHNAALHTPEALPAIIEKLQADGYSLMKASELIHDGEYTLDHEGRQIPKTGTGN